ncbi:MAG TPA: HesA/MoeB/ThiF family protein [Clostridia bacterium]|nr:HesA/MoeB/ThiF family protein [Clostridia bacterium]
MILEREQIQRYMRHIIIPEIGGPGQKKLLDSSILVCCEGISNCAVLLYYLSAMGIGKIDCYAANIDGIELITQNARGLNPDLQLRIIDISGNQKLDLSVDYNVTIMFYEKAISNPEINIANIPLIFTAVAGGYGYIKTVRARESVGQVIDDINSLYADYKECSVCTLFGNAYLGFNCTLTAIETVKVLLDIGSVSEQALHYNLSTYTFACSQANNEKPEYSINLESAREELSRARILIVGSGGLGSPAAYALVMSGIGKLGLIDFDTVEISNLNRQILHSADTIGMAKVRSAERFLRTLNPDIELCTYEQRFSIENAEALISDYDIVIDGLDNLPNRYLLNDMCYFLKKPLLEAGVLRFDGLVTTILPGRSPCYRCIFPEAEDNSPVPSCSETGVLGAVPGIMGMLQAIEAIKYLTGIGVPLVNKILMFDAMKTDFTLLDIDKAVNCELCGTNPTIRTPKNYEFICKNQ